ncbi:sulfite exporter TauE/SafE family protein [Candidatus Woesearchaeota archaeon]|nr:sulfite exporter TauE/SafE family protein [Candidatus Woesearchaeota archaeon]
MAETTLVIAFIAGLISFLSPCVLPLIPGFLSYMSGVSASEASNSSKARAIVFLNTIFFVLGFTIVFSILGVLINSIFADAAFGTRTWLGRIGGVIIIVFGLVLMKVLKLPFLEKEHKFKVKKFRISYVTSFMFGLAFAAGWTPCIGAVLASILTLAAVSANNAFYLLISYSLGLTLPFLITGLFVSRMQNFIQKHEKTLSYINLVFGILLVILGIMVFTNTLSLISNFTPLQNIFNV